MNPILNAFLIPRLTTYIQSLQRTGTDRKISLKKRFKARRELLEAHDTLRENLNTLAGAEALADLWNQQIGMQVRVIATKQLGTIISLGPTTTRHVNVIVDMSMGEDNVVRAYAVNELEVVLPPGIWEFPH